MRSTFEKLTEAVGAGIFGIFVYKVGNGSLTLIQTAAIVSSFVLSGQANRLLGPITKKALSAGSLLRLINVAYWFCGKSGRETLECIRADLTKDVRLMRDQGHGEWFIRVVLLWQIFGGTFLPLLWGKLISVLRHLSEAAGLIRKIKG